ncbi:MAG: signal peptidase II [Microthrixaceae bacterium]|nr:signal peptidase II [Microthrixaceae bacterium]
MTDSAASKSDDTGSASGDGSVSHARPGLEQRLRWSIVAALAIVTLAVDQLSKRAMLASLDIGEPVSVLGPLRWNLAFNTGMAFSRGANAGPIIGLIALVITSVMIVLARNSNSKFQLVAMGAIIGGALGNVLDRLLRVGNLGSPIDGGFMSGAVVDFIDLQFWPIFNVADMAVVVGGLALALSMLWVDDRDESAIAEVAESVDSSSTSDESPDVGD